MLYFTRGIDQLQFTNKNIIKKNMIYFRQNHNCGNVNIQLIIRINNNTC